MAPSCTKRTAYLAFFFRRFTSRTYNYVRVHKTLDVTPNLVGAKTEAISFRVDGRRDLEAVAIFFMASPWHVAARAVGTGYYAPP